MGVNAVPYFIQFHVFQQYCAGYEEERKIMLLYLLPTKYPTMKVSDFGVAEQAERRLPKCESTSHGLFFEFFLLKIMQ